VEPGRRHATEVDQSATTFNRAKNPGMVAGEAVAVTVTFS
jgi:hypothetical protein